MKSLRYVLVFLTAISCFAIMSCEDFVAIDAPDFQIVGETVFEDPETAEAAVTGIYNQLYNGTTYYSNGWQNSVTVLAGMSADLVRPRVPEHSKYGPFWENEISTSIELANSDSSANVGLWNSAYNIIYLANSVLEGLDGLSGIPEDTLNRLKGQALFIRSFTYFYLTNLYGDVPLLLTIDYRKNALAPRNPAVEVWVQIMNDLDGADLLLDGTVDYPGGERTQINQFVVKAFRARVHLYQQDWDRAEELSSRVILENTTYGILEDLDEVFLANSREAIWQISPLGRGNVLTNTNEGGLFIMHPLVPTLTQITLSDQLISAMRTEDKRLAHWTGYNARTDSYFIHKYKVMNSTSNEILEYSMVMRLAEQYLIRAEARAMLGKLPEAISDVDRIRVRAGLEPIAETDPGIGKEALLALIMEERKRELFAEWGHRWLDLKRTEKATEILSPLKPHWQNTDIFYPIPEQERIRNPRLDQNEGY